MNIWLAIVLILLALVGGIFIGFYLARNVIEKQLQENPPIDKNTMRALLAQTGQKPSEAKLNQMMKTMQAASKKAKK